MNNKSIKHFKELVISYNLNFFIFYNLFNYYYNFKQFLKVDDLL